MFRGFPIDNPDAFEKMLDVAEFENMPYVGGAAPRNNVTQRRVFTANESPPVSRFHFTMKWRRCRNHQPTYSSTDLPRIPVVKRPSVTAMPYINAVHEIDLTFVQK